MSITSPEMLKSLFSSAPSAMIIADVERNIIDVNPSFRRIFQYEKAEAQRLKLANLYVEPSEFRRIQDLIAKGSDSLGSKFYASYRRGDGSVFPGQASLMELTSPDGTQIGIAGIINDLTEIAGDDVSLLMGIEQLTAERSRQKTLYMRSPAMMHSIDADGFIQTVTDAWLARFGYLEHEVIGKRSTAFLTPESQIYARNVVLPEFWRTGACDRVPYTFVCKDGSLVEIELSAVLDETLGKPVTLAVLQDVSERNASRRTLEQRNEDLRNFAHIAAHDLQAPVRHISAFTEMLRCDLKAGELDDVENSLNVISKSAAALHELIHALLDFSVTGDATIGTSPNDTNVMIDEVTTMLAEEIRLRQALIDVPVLPRLRCDRSLMLRVFANLFGNSLKYIEPDQKPQVSVSGSSDGNWTVLQFCDNGIGIPEPFRDQVFQPLRRLHGADSEYAGTGIGLALCKRIVEAHGGTIQVADSGKVGTRIELRLPN